MAAAVTAHMRGHRWGGKENGPNPTDRAKPEMKDHVLVDGRGVPLSVEVTAANINDHIALPELLFVWRALSSHIDSSLRTRSKLDFGHF
jgi:hypothetical protein